MEGYAIRGGRPGYERLQLLARDRWPDTEALFARAGLRSGMQVPDLGCGGGEVTFEIARIVAPAQVIGVDMDEMKLNLARDAATADGVANVLFRAMNLHDWHETAAYDAVFTRFVLHHIREPVAVLRSMWEGVRPGGVLIVEDADFDGWPCHPPNPGFEFFKRTYAEIVHRWGGDHAIGRKLPAYFREAGVSRPEIKLVHPIYLEGETKMLPWTTLEATAEPIVAEAIASREEVEAALDDLASFSEDPESVIVGPGIFQLWSRRPT